MRWLVPVLLTLAAGCHTPIPEVIAAEPQAAGLSSLSLTRLDGSKLEGSELAGKVVLFVNVASKCGFTPQYEGLQALYEARQAEGLVIVGVPSNQFAGQEPGAPEEIASFCKLNYGVTFPLLEKQDVNGGQRSALYAWLVGSKVGGGERIGWNFEKFVVNRKGEVVARFGSRTAPADPALKAALDAALAATP
jgi:glutathione peroxidase-family protein